MEMTTKIDQSMSNIEQLFTKILNEQSCNNIKYFMAEVFVKNFKYQSDKDRKRLIQQDILVPRDIFKCDEITLGEAKDYLLKHYPSTVPLNPTPDQIKMIYCGIMIKTKEYCFDHDKFREFIRSLDKESKYFKNLNTYKVQSVKIQSYGSYPTCGKRKEIYSCSSCNLDFVNELIECGEMIKLTINLI